MDYGQKSVEYRKKKNIIRVRSTDPITNRDDLSTFYTPGVATVSLEIAQNKSKVYDLTMKRNSVAVITDGSAVLGLGNIGPEAALPVMEGKAMLFAEFAGIDAFPICLATQNSDEIVQTIQNIAPGFGGINLEDFSAPRCFEIEDRLQDLGIPVMHDDQHGTAVVVLAGLINALKVANKKIENIKIVISGAGAAGTAIVKIISRYSNKKATIFVLDREGSIYIGRPGLSREKQDLAILTGNRTEGGLHEIIRTADVFIGVSAPNILTEEMVRLMNKDSVIFAMANPIPEIDPLLALKAGAFIVATGRSDFPNQINNVLAFPGIFRGALDARVKNISEEMLLSAALALANFVQTPTKDEIVPSPLDRGVAAAVAKAIKLAVNYSNS